MRLAITILCLAHRWHGALCVKLSAPALTPSTRAADIVRTYDYSGIARGQLFVAENWLSDELCCALRRDARTILARGEFDDTEEPIAKRLKRELYRDNWAYGDEQAPSEARGEARRLFDALRAELEGVVGRRLFMNELYAQAKYSIAQRGEPICWHVDQLHEAFTGNYQFYADLHRQRTRRGLAWLLYLSDDGWGEPGGSGSGGVLRAYPRRDGVGRCGRHEGNLQVGWLEGGGGSEPVFLDCWGMPHGMDGLSLDELRRAFTDGYAGDAAALQADLQKVQPTYVLYRLGAGGRREDLCEPHAAPGGDARGGLGHVPSLREMLPLELRASFSSTLCRDHPLQPPVEVQPRGGTLVVFDPVVVPHEVSAVLAGERLALFGFFAEERPVPPAWADSSSTGPSWFLDGWAHTDDGGSGSS